MARGELVEQKPPRIKIDIDRLMKQIIAEPNSKQSDSN